MTANIVQEAPVQESIKPVHETSRCDGCGCRAHVKVRLANGGKLTFCKNHYERNADSLLAAQAEVVEDTRYVLYA